MKTPRPELAARRLPVGIALPNAGTHARTLLRAVAAALRTAWLLVGITLAALVAAELIGAHWVSPDADAQGILDPRARADGYAGAPWVDAYFREFAAANHVEWRPYVYWRRKPFAGRYINIDGRGVRRTWNPAPDGSTPAKRVFVFGGSTMWGTGARDDHTIASEISRTLATQRPGEAVEVTNFAEGGYVLTQEVVALLRELQQGNVPDLVIFFDGVNDVFATFQSGAPGTPQNEMNRVREFNIDVDDRIYREAAARFVKQSALYALAGGAAAKGVMWAPPWSASMEELGDRTVDFYASTIDLVRRLAAAYHFRVLFYWQPVIFTKQILTPYEQAEADKQSGLADFFTSVYGKIRQRVSAPDVHHLGDLFAEASAPYFVDFCHLTEQGNEQVAAAMAPDAAAALDATAPAAHPTGR